MASGGATLENPTEIILTRHAKRRMKWRKISFSEVQMVIAEPDIINQYPLDPSLTNALKTMSGRRILVT